MMIDNNHSKWKWGMAVRSTLDKGVLVGACARTCACARSCRPTAVCACACACNIFSCFINFYTQQRKRRRS